MRRLLGALWLVAGFLLASNLGYACGDKLLILGRPLRFNARPASIMAYAPVGSALESMLVSQQWNSAMTRGKHQVQVVKTPERLYESLEKERFDLILVALADVSALSGQLANTSSPPVVIPVVGNVARETVRTAEKDYGVVVRSNAKTGDYLSAIDRALELYDLRVQAARGKKIRNSGS